MTQSPIYILDRTFDDPRYDGFYTLVDDSKPSLLRLADGVPRVRADRNWRVLRLSETWNVPTVLGKARKFHDYPCVDLAIPAFSPRAVEVLRDLLEPNGELLPINTKQGSYYIYNTTTIVDLLDRERSEVNWYKDGFTAFAVKRYEVKDGVSHPGIFRIPEKPSTLHANDDFVRRVREHGLNGMTLTRVWPLPPGVDWQVMQKRASEKQQTKGLVAGESVKGHSVIIRLPLGKPTSTGTPSERRAIDRLMDELEDRLLDGDAGDSPAVGSVEGSDFGVPGECRLFLAGPNAYSLFAAIRPVLEGLKWEHDIQVVRREGHFTDGEAAEEIEVFVKDERRMR